MEERKIGRVGELAWVIGISICALGVCLSTKGGYGVSMIVAPAYVVYLKISQIFDWFTFGMAEYLLQGILLVVLSMLVGKVKLKYLFTFLAVICYGICLDFWNWLFGMDVFTLIWMRVASSILGGLITSFAVACVLRTYLPQEAYEMFVKEIAVTFHKDMNKVKWVYDLCSLAVGILLMFIIFHKFSFQIIGPYTLATAVLNAPIITVIGRFLDRHFEYTPLFGKKK